MDSAEITQLRPPPSERDAVVELDLRLDMLETGLRNLSEAEGRRHRATGERLERIEQRLATLIARLERRRK